ncbi:MAG: flippase [Anaeromyxobacter sp.]
MAILRNTSYTFLGQLVPAGVAVACVPPLIRNLGDERVGMLTLVWVIIGYFSILDFGLGFAVTKSVSEAIARRDQARIPSLFWGAVAAQAFLGVLGGALLYAAVPWLVGSRLGVSGPLVMEAQAAFRWCAVAIPLLLCASSVTGLLHAAQRFDLAVKVQLPVSVAQYVLPVVISAWTKDLGWIVAALLVNRVVGTLATSWLAARVFPEIRSRPVLDRSLLLGQLRFGSWLTVSSVLSPLMVYVDRFVIGAVQSLASVAYYAVPLDAVMKFSTLPNSLSTVLFPAFSFHSVSERDRGVELLLQGYRGLLLVLVVPIAIGIVFSGDVLQLWLGAGFASQSSRVLQILLVGIWANSLTRVPYVFVSSSGRPDIIGKAMILQTPIQLALCYVLVRRYGLEGAAFAWSGRLVLELAFYLAVAGRISGRPVLLPALQASLRPFVGMVALVVLGVMAGALAPGARALVGLLLVVGGGVHVLVGCMNASERLQLMRILGKAGVR